MTEAPCQVTDVCWPYHRGRVAASGDAITSAEADGNGRSR